MVHSTLLFTSPPQKHKLKRPRCSPASCRTSAGADQRSSSSSSHSNGSNSKKVEVIDLTLDSSSEDEGQDSPPPPPPPLPPPPKRACPSMSPTSPPVINKGSATLRHCDLVSTRSLCFRKTNGAPFACSHNYLDVKWFMSSCSWTQKYLREEH